MKPLLMFLYFMYCPLLSFYTIRQLDTARCNTVLQNCKKNFPTRWNREILHLLSYKPKNSPYQRRNTRGKHRFQSSSNPSIRVWSGCRIFAQAHRRQFLQGNRKHALRRAAQCKIPLRKSDSQHNRRSYAYIPYCMKYFPVRQYFILSAHAILPGSQFLHIFLTKNRPFHSTAGTD